jgi:hypothetical protein
LPRREVVATHHRARLHLRDGARRIAVLRRIESRPCTSGLDVRLHPLVAHRHRGADRLDDLAARADAEVRPPHAPLHPAHALLLLQRALLELEVRGGLHLGDLRLIEHAGVAELLLQPLTRHLRRQPCRSLHRGLLLLRTDLRDGLIRRGLLRCALPRGVAERSRSTGARGHRLLRRDVLRRLLPRHVLRERWSLPHRHRLVGRERTVLPSEGLAEVLPAHGLAALEPGHPLLLEAAVAEERVDAVALPVARGLRAPEACAAAHVRLTRAAVAELVRHDCFTRSALQGLASGRA